MDYCANIEVIPQFSGTCWFNAILMICLYSDGVSRIFRETSIKDKWANSEDGFKVALFNILSYINRIKLNNDNKEKQEEYNIKLNKYLNKINPEVLLLDFINKYDKNLKKIFIKNNKLNSIITTNLGYSFIYILKIFNILKINSIDIFINYDYKQTLLDYTFNFLKTEDEIKLKLESSPDIIYFTDSKSIENYRYESDEIYDTELYDLDLIDLMDYKEIININGSKYKLDSIGVVNYNDLNINHIIAGITCNNNKYVYNGWFSQSTDRAIKKQIDGFNNSPCNLMKYDWNIKKDEEFCLNVNECKLDFENIDKNDLCFSFAKGDRYFIYTKIRNDKEDLYSTSISKTSLNISKIKKDVFNKKFESNLEYIKSVSFSSSSSISKSLNKKDYIIPYIIDNNINIPEEIINEIDDNEYLKIYGIKKNKLTINEIKNIVKNNYKKELLNILTIDQLNRIIDISEKSLSLLSIDDITKDKIIDLILTNKIKLNKEILEKFDDDLLNNIFYYFKYKDYNFLTKLKKKIIENNNLIHFIILYQLPINELRDILIKNNISFNSNDNKAILIYLIFINKINYTNIITSINNDNLLITYAKYHNSLLFKEPHSNKVELLELLNEDDLNSIIKSYDIKLKTDITKHDIIKLILKPSLKIVNPLIYINEYSSISFYIKTNNISKEDIIIEINKLINESTDKLKKDILNKLSLNILNKIFEKYKDINREYLLKSKLIKKFIKFKFDVYYDILKENIPDIFIKICINIYYNSNDRYKRKLLKELSEEELLKFNIKNKKELIPIENILEIKSIDILDNYKSYICNPLNKNKILKLLDEDDLNKLLKIYDRSQITSK